MNTVPLSQIIADFKITLDGDDYVSNVSDVALRNFALRGIREIGFDIGKKVRSIKLPIESNNTVTLPEDFVDLNKIGVVGSDGLLYGFIHNKNINQSQEYSLDATGNKTTDDTDDDVLYKVQNTVYDREDSKTPTDPDMSNANDYYDFVFENYLYNGGIGSIYGLGGARNRGEYRINLDQNRIEISTRSSTSEVVLEYVADEARSSDPSVHVYAEEALRAYIYWKLVERKSSVPANEKGRARSEWYNERRKANARLSTFSKDEALKTIRKNFKLAPKY
jgi:hypothetical protein